MYLAPDLSNAECDKYQVFVEAKHPKKLFSKSVERQIDLLEVIHSDLRDS